MSLKGNGLVTNNVMAESEATMKQKSPGSLNDKGNRDTSPSNKGAAGHFDFSHFDQDRRRHHEMKTEGPPPLVPILKQGSSEAAGHVTARSSLPNSSHLHSHTAATSGGVFDARNDAAHISLMADYKRMRDFIDMKSLMKPLSKEIDQSLEDIRRAVGVTMQRDHHASDLSHDHPVSSNPPSVSRQSRDHSVSSHSSRDHPASTQAHPANLPRDYHRAEFTNVHIPSKMTPISQDSMPAHRRYQANANYGELKIDVIDAFENQHRVAAPGN